MNQQQSVRDVKKIINKHAYLIVANNNLSVLRSCIQLLDDIRNDIYILFDKKANVNIKAFNDNVKTKHSSLFVTCCISVNWGGVFSSGSCCSIDKNSDIVRYRL